VPVSDAAYKQGSKVGDVSYIRPASTFTNIKEPVDVFNFHVKTSYRNTVCRLAAVMRESEGRKCRAERNRLFQDSDTQIHDDAASQTLRTKSESFTW